MTLMRSLSNWGERRVKFNAANHTYAITEGRAEIAAPSVSNIIRPLRNFSDIPPEVLSRAAERGKIVHAITELLDGGGDGSGLHPSVLSNPELGGYAKAYIEFRKTVDYEVCAVEEPVANFTYGYAGTLDRVFWDLKERRMVVLDIKSGRIDPADFVQVVAYGKALQSSHEPDGDIFKDKWIEVPVAHQVLYLNNSGGWEMKTVDERELYYWQVFLSCLTIHNWRGKNG